MPTLTILGSGDAFHSGGRSHSGYLLEKDGEKILIDCGATTLLRLKENKIPTDSLTALTISHFHGDHLAGLPFLLLDMARLKRKKVFHIISPQGGRNRAYEALKLFYPGNESILEELSLQWHYFNEEESVEVNDWQVQAFPAKHTEAVQPHALRISFMDKILAYSGDTGWTPKLIAVAHEADVFICECTFFDSVHENHLNYQQIKLHRENLKCKRILLTHFYEEMLRHAGDVEMEMAQDGLRIRL